MTSKSKQIKMIRKRKDKAHKANVKTDQKRIEKNHEVLTNLAKQD
jgi:hypothetical protein